MAEVERATRDKAGRWQKGVSGNPTGGKKVPESVREMLRDAVPDAVQVLVETLQDPEQPRKLRVQCAESVLDRVYGKAAQMVEMSAQIGITDADKALINAVKARMDAKTANDNADNA